MSKMISLSCVVAFLAWFSAPTEIDKNVAGGIDWCDSRVTEQRQCESSSGQATNCEEIVGGVTVTSWIYTLDYIERGQTWCNSQREEDEFGNNIWVNGVQQNCTGGWVEHYDALCYLDTWSNW